jgi:hypothetical protein
MVTGSYTSIFPLPAPSKNSYFSQSLSIMLLVSSFGAAGHVTHMLSSMIKEQAESLHWN